MSMVMPSFSWTALADGSLGADIDSWMADFIPGRDFFVGVNGYYERATLRQPSEDIYMAEGDRLVEKPNVWAAERVEINSNAIEYLASTVQIPVDLMIVPSAGWAAKDSIIGIGDEYQDEAFISDIYSRFSAARSFDVAGLFAKQDDPASLYYRTDHHWTSRGAYLTANAYAQSKGMGYPEESEFSVKTVDGFYGTTYSRSALWLTPGESIELWDGPADLTVSNAETDGTHAGVFYEERLREQDKYTVYLDGNHSLVRIENPDAEGKLLVIRDSYSNCLGGFLAESYGTVILVDLRYYNDSVQELCAQEGFDQILVCYSLYNYLTDTNIVKLY